MRPASEAVAPARRAPVVVRTVSGTGRPPTSPDAVIHTGVSMAGPGRRRADRIRQHAATSRRWRDIVERPAQPANNGQNTSMAERRYAQTARSSFQSQRPRHAVPHDISRAGGQETNGHSVGKRRHASSRSRLPLSRWHSATCSPGRKRNVTLQIAMQMLSKSYQ